MSLNLNHVTLAGNLTRDPELRQVGTDKAVANFSVAVNRRWRNAAGEQVEEATFVDVEAWGRVGEVIGQYLKKGSPAYIEGRLKLDTWEDKDGQKRSRLKIVAEQVQFLGTRPTSDHETATESAAPAAAGRARATTTRRPAPVKRTADDPTPF